MPTLSSHHWRAFFRLFVWDITSAWMFLITSPALSQQNSWISLIGPCGATVRAISRDSCGLLYVATDGGVYRSSDNGDYWELLHTPKTSTSSFLTEISLFGCRVVVIHGIYTSLRSTDSGLTWQSIGTTRWSFRMDSVGRVYAASKDGIWVSHDTTLSWARFALAGKYIKQILLRDGGGMFCLSDSGIYRSFSNGASWNYAALPDSQVTELVMNSRGIFFSRSFDALFRSNDSGATWKSITPAVRYIHVHDILINGPNEIWAATSNGVYRSVDDGDTWTLRTPPGGDVLTLGHDRNGNVLSGTFEDISVYSTESGQWTLKNNGLRSLRITSIALGQHGAIAATGLEKVFVSTDQGVSWNTVYRTSANGRVYVFAAPSGTFFISASDGLMRSADNGSTWSTRLQRKGSEISDVASNRSGRIVASFREGEILISQDDGVQWQTALPKVPARTLRAVAVDNDGWVYALTDSSTLFVSANGKSWEELPIPRFWSWNEGTMCVDKAGAIYISSYGGVLRSTDRGSTWTTFGGELATYPGRKVTADQQGNVFAAAYQSIYRFADRSDAWDYIGSIPGSPGFITSLAVTPDGVVFVGTQEDGLFSSTRQFGHRIPTPPKDFALLQNFPNPFNSATTIEFQLPKAAFISLRVYNVLGQLITRLVHENMEAGNHRVRWDSRSPSGIYFYRLETLEFLETKKMILMK